MNTDTFKMIIYISFGAILMNNFVLSNFLGICPFLGVSKKLSSAVGMGVAVIFVMTLASVVTYLTNTYLLVPYNLEYLQTLTFILVIAGLVQFIEMFMKKALPSLYKALGIYLPLITTNCAVLGVALLNVQYGYNLWQSALYGATGGLGFMIATIIFAGIRERLDMNDVPKYFKGLPIALITAAFLSMAFTGFKGMFG
ncbi:MAG TPA: electron transport complex subunit RsxA [Clostridia bacterium]|jgi:electron transport complex protein RnfA|nr:electron transport complex subunit RsxA [Clostridia bacterium]HOM35032.1 electron transport complex subunit RsxA [Clostridia bacterium]HOR89570.1 electron transport complex subunit RsxA [Clostridia bacterium]HOT70024.1 electron transport complex subunit RsxA [Clostridia bacterium]HPL07794.1 electron transport complex subunit RsxA [Clostridia bacterium]